jgi:hypothetical protein
MLEALLIILNLLSITALVQWLYPTHLNYPLQSMEFGP